MTGGLLTLQREVDNGVQTRRKIFVRAGREEYSRRREQPVPSLRDLKGYVWSTWIAEPRNNRSEYKKGSGRDSGDEGAKRS